MPRHKQEVGEDEVRNEARDEAQLEPEVPEEAHEMSAQELNDIKDKRIADLSDTVKRMGKILDQVAAKQNIPTGEKVKEFVDGEFTVPYLSEGNIYTQKFARIAEWKAVGSFEQPIGEAFEKHFIYDVTFVNEDGTTHVEKKMPHRVFKNLVQDAIKRPCSAKNYFKRVQEGDHYVYRGVRTLSGSPYANDEEIEVTLGTLQPDGVTKVYDGKTTKVRFYSLNS